MKGRLAVECDGDIWHGVERFQEDMARQRMLERSGLTFWRVRGSTFYRDPGAALEKLWSMLDQLKIYPTNYEESSDNPSNAEQTDPSNEGFQDTSSIKKDGREELHSPPIHEDKKVSLDDLVPLIIKALKKHADVPAKKKSKKGYMPGLKTYSIRHGIRRRPPPEFKGGDTS
jgi:hypothetical protein